MLEALFAIAVFSFGLMGLAGMQSAALRAQTRVLLQAQAGTIAAELGERLRANPLGVQAGAYSGSVALSALTDTAVAAPSLCDGALAPVERARCDLRAAARLAYAALPDGALALDSVDAGVARISLMWTDAGARASMARCDPDGGGDLRRCCVRPVTEQTRCLNLMVALE